MIGAAIADLGEWIVGMIETNRKEAMSSTGDDGATALTKALYAVEDAYAEISTLDMGDYYRIGHESHRKLGAAISHLRAALSRQVEEEEGEWSGSPDPADPDNFWIDDRTGERKEA
jgi:hypothetical protein